MTISESGRTSVYLAMDINGEPVIYKTIKGTDRQKLYESLSRCKSEYFPEIKKWWSESGKTHVVEEYIEGKTLDKVIREGMPLKDALSVIKQLMEAVKALHSMDPPLLHRDIKPENILITSEGALKLIDFEAAREYSDEDKERDTVLLGTRGYAAPEQFGYNQTDVRSDIYSVGIVCNLIMEAVTDDKGRKSRICKVFTKATMFDPKERYESIDRMYTDFLRKSSGKNRHIILGLCILVIFIAFAGIVYAVIRHNTVLNEPKEIQYYNMQVMPADYSFTPVKKKVLKAKETGMLNGLIHAGNVNGAVFHYLKAYPEAFLIYDYRLEDSYVKKVTFTRYSPNGKQMLDKFDLAADNDYMTRGGLFCINAEAFTELMDGNYDVSIQTGGDSFTYRFVIHDADEDAGALDALFTAPVQYYSRSSDNSLFYYVYNTPYSVEDVFINGGKLSKNGYTLTRDGRGIVIHGEAMDPYEEPGTAELTVKMRNEKTAQGTIVIIP